MKEYCNEYTANVDNKGILIDKFCKFYNGSKQSLESCAYKCGKKSMKEK